MSGEHFSKQKHLLPSKLTDAYHNKFGVVEMEQLAPSIEAWFDTSLGTSLLQAEQAKLDEALGNLFGYHLLQLSVDRRIKLFGSSKVNHCFGLHPLHTNEPVNTGVCSYEQLPLAKNSVDVAVLHHVIDFAEKPHRLLREVVSTIVPHGHVVIIGFNPFSAMGLMRFVSRHTTKKPHQRSHSLRKSRVVDWLRLLDCEPVRVIKGFGRGPGSGKAISNAARWIEAPIASMLQPFGGFYMIIARKDQVAATPVKPQWQSVSVMNGFSVGKIASRVPESTVVKTSTDKNH